MLKTFAVRVLLLLSAMMCMNAQAVVEEPSMGVQSTAVSPTVVRHRLYYEYPANYPCNSFYSGQQNILFSVREVDTNNNEVAWVGLYGAGEHLYWAYDPEVGNYQVCATYVDYYTQNAHGTVYVWIDLYGLWDVNWVFAELPYPF